MSPPHTPSSPTDRAARSARRRAAIVAVLVVLLLALHLDFWRPQRVVLYFGWLPEELLVRLAWTLAAWALVAFACAPAARGAAEGDEEPRP